MCERRQKDGMTNVPSSRLPQTSPPQVGAEETKGGHSGRQMAEAGVPTWDLDVSHPHLPRSMLFEAFRFIDSGGLAGVTDLKRIFWSGKYTAESTPELWKEAICCTEIENKKIFFFLLVKEAVLILNPALPHPLASSPPCIFNRFWNPGWLLGDVATLFLCILSHCTI